MELTAFYTHFLAISKPIVAQSYKRVRIFTSDREHLLTDGEIRNLRLEKIGDFDLGFYHYNYLSIDFSDSSQNIYDINENTNDGTTTITTIQTESESLSSPDCFDFITEYACAPKVDNGECHDYVDYMTTNCEKSCGFCTEPMD